jgi:quercetin dioxygenase-like cupin family protein
VPLNSSEESGSNSDRKISRRNFLNFIGATGAIFTLSSLAPSAKVFAVGANTTYTNSSQTNLPSPPPPPQPTEMALPHVFNLDMTIPQISNINGGSRTIVNADNFPILNGNGMAAYLLRLKKRGVYEPHWHPNAAELSYCINGRAIMTIFSPNAGYDSVTIDPGELVFVP